MENLDSESYWNRSTSKAFSFDDDADDNADNRGVGLPSSISSGILNDDTISEASFDNSAFEVGAINLSIKSIISDEALACILNEQSLDDLVITKGITPEEELKLLRRQIQTLNHPSPEVTAQKLLFGKTVQLEVFKSRSEKLQLLDAVLDTGGGHAVIGVLLFLKKTLNRANFYKILKERPQAQQHYISYLTFNQPSYEEAVELLQLSGRRQDAALLQFQQACKIKSPQLRKQHFRQLLERYSGGEGGVSNLYLQIFHATHKLFELLEQEHSTLGKLLPTSATPVEVLHALCRQHGNWKEQNLVSNLSPFRFCAEQQISAAQFEWTALNERASALAYADLECIFERIPAWHPMKQKQFHISFPLEAAVCRLHKLDAPPVVLYLFLSKITNASEKLQLAQQVKCNKAIIDALCSLKDVGQLTQLRDTLPERSEEQFHCDNALKSLQSKRWSTDNIKLKL